MRKLAYKYGQQLTPRMGSFEALYYALDLNDPSCNVALPAAAPPVEAEQPSTVPANGIFVAPRSGSDSADGSINSPLRSIQAALDVAARTRPTPPIVLREGTHYLEDTLMITPLHSNLTISAYPGEKPVVSGGVELTGLACTAHNISAVLTSGRLT